MQLDHNSFYQHRIIPWYDSTFLCWIVILMSVVFFIFGLTGIFTAAGNILYKKFLWVPSLISTLSLFIVIRTIVRLINRNKNV